MVSCIEKSVHDVVGHNASLAVYYQPIVNRRGVVDTLEALTRIETDRGSLHPVAFLGEIDTRGALHDLSLWVLEKSARLLRKWQLDGLSAALAVNVPVSVACDPMFVEAACDVLRTHDVDATCIEVEIVECASITSSTDLDQLHRMREHGFGISIDDFGAGFNGFSHLMNIPATRIKLDRDVIRSAVTRRGRDVLEKIISFLHSLYLPTAVEGVESQGDAETAVHCGADALQGFFYGPPAPEVLVETCLFRERHAHAQRDEYAPGNILEDRPCFL
jgi:EAL domain-containing protein (putative c-di-GMP-specific phosphodiesterase class I)